ncbi:S41 family peptidase [Acidobacteria bacterium AB60]|nr:S41 family peptidase [Acidobacteria bacterium AB60]
MNRLQTLVCAAMLLFGVGQGTSEVAIPNTPAGRTLQAWLEAFDSGDRAKIENYVKTIDPNQSVDGMLAFRGVTGGVDLLSIESSEPLHIRFRAKDRNSAIIGLGNLIVKDGQPPTVQTFGLRAMPPGVEVENVVVDAALRQKVVEGIATNLNEFYVDGPLAKQMGDAITAHLKAGDYDKITDGDQLAAQLHEDLRGISHDKHLRVDFSPFKMPPMGPPSAEDEARFHHDMEQHNCAFDKVEILSGNIGYIKFDGFMDAGFCGATVNAAMTFVAHTDALIFDIRQNGGGQPAMVTLIASYLFAQPTHLIDIYNRHEDSTQQNWTLSYLPGPRLPKVPVYVLTSKRTFSGAEEFAFDLKNQKRATIVGEVTGGGAHPVSPHLVADYFMVGVPFAKSLDPATKTNWEGTGVEPDVKVAADDALTTAEKLAQEKIKSGKEEKDKAKASLK